MINFSASQRYANPTHEPRVSQATERAYYLTTREIRL